MTRPEQTKQQQPRQQQTMQRLFFALWPEDAARQAIASVAKLAAQHHQGKLIRTDNLHLTLAFLGNVTEKQRECAEAVAESVSMTPFSLCLDHIGWFKRPKVLWLGSKETPDALMHLVASLNQGLRACDIVLDDRPFATHLTLMRKVKKLYEIDVETIDWHVDRFCLVESITHREGVEYKVIKSWQ